MEGIGKPTCHIWLTRVGWKEYASEQLELSLVASWLVNVSESSYLRQETRLFANKIGEHVEKSGNVLWEAEVGRVLPNQHECMK